MRFFFISLLGWLAVSLGACSLVLDTDVLNEGSTEKSTDSQVDVITCEASSDCTDAFDCTKDVCEDGICVYLPDKSVCKTLELCSVTEGCVPSGDECRADSGCDDGIDCTIDICQIGQVGVCKNVPDHSACSHLAANCLKSPICDPDAGECVAGDPVSCDAPQGICMGATCNSETGICEEHRLSGDDDDGDGFLDASCGGDDCSDNDGQAYPGAKELCNSTDNDCDGHVDFSWNREAAQVVTTGGALDILAVAANDDHVAVTATMDGVAQVFLLDSAGAQVATPFDFSAVETGSLGSVALAGNDSGFAMVWITGNPDAPSLKLATFSYDSGNGGQLAFGPVQTINSTGSNFTSPVLLWDEVRTNAGWALLWGARSTGGQALVRFQTHDMGAAADVFATGAGVTTSLDAQLMGANSYAVTFAGAYDGLTGGDEEVFAGQVSFDGVDATANNLMAPVSGVDTDGVNDDDPSNSAVVGVSALQNRFVAYVDNNGFSNTLKVYDAQAEQNTSLVNTNGFDFSHLHLLSNGESYGFFYLDDLLARTAVKYKQLQESGVSGLDKRVETELLRVYADDAEDIVDLAVALTGQHQYLVLWVRSGTEQYLEAALLKGCAVL